MRLLKQNKQEIRILKNISGEVRPGQLTLLLGPPSSGGGLGIVAYATLTNAGNNLWASVPEL